ncbi:pantoate--beta-alanine ligase [Candidatus Poribacteria bacterium]|nr:pantoate--beta-alanine ligase [Candidatus Poribacteria bacterium]OUT66401.1 MAG: pantoate--beta-alanine ligase [bacterium TMED15]
MEVQQTINATRSWSQYRRYQGKSVGFVPTMGALHQGHLSLVRQARKDNDFVVVSVFVNPIQFAPNEDFDNYPRKIRLDLDLLEKECVDLVFAPSSEEMYPKEDSRMNQTWLDVVGPITEGLCGISRPTFFRGVTTVVAKLFNIVQPKRAYFGWKDAQQLAAIRQMVNDLNFDLEVIGLPIVREDDGLAMSSRNAYLTKDERQEAKIVYQSLELAKSRILRGETSVKKITTEMKLLVEDSALSRIDYTTIVLSQTFKPILELENGQDILIAIATYVGSTRLIDNFRLKVPQF